MRRVPDRRCLTREFAAPKTRTARSACSRPSRVAWKSLTLLAAAALLLNELHQLLHHLLAARCLLFSDRVDRLHDGLNPLDKCGVRALPRNDPSARHGVERAQIDR